MSSRCDPIQLLTAQLSDSTHLEWLVHGQPVIALFSKSGKPAYTAFDREHLGQPSRHDRNQGLRLYIALDDATNKLLVTLTQEIQVSNGKKPRVFFLCVSVESLSIETGPPAFWTMSDGVVPMEPLDDPANVKPNRSSRLLRTTFSPATKSWVIMPKFPHTGRVSPESMSLLRKLKALSQAPHFDLFTTHDSWSQQGLLKAQKILTEPNVTGFNINYANFYPAGRDAVVDSWESQGWRPLEQVEKGDRDGDGIQSCQRPRLKRRRVEEPDAAADDAPHHTPVFALDAAPDAAPDVASDDAPDNAPNAALDVAPDAATALPPPYDPAGSTASFDMAAALATDHIESGEDTHSLLSEIYPRGRSISIDPRPVTNQCVRLSLHQDVTKTRLTSPSPPPVYPLQAHDTIIQPSISHGLHQEHTGLKIPPVYQVTSQAHNAILQPSISDRKPPSSPQILCTPNDLPKELPQVPERNRSASRIPETPSLRGSTEEDQSPQSLLFNECRDTLVIWLAKLMKFYPHAHYVCITDLLALGVALRNLDTDYIRICRARGLTTLVEHYAKNNEKRGYTDVAAEQLFDGKGVFELVSWLLILDSNADLMFLDQIQELAWARKELLACSTSLEASGERVRHLDKLMCLKAGIVLDACVEFGAKVLDKDEYIAYKMMAEKGRNEFC